MGASLMLSKISSSFFSQELSIISRTSSKGIGGTSHRRFSSSSQYSFGRISGLEDIICPNLIKVGPSSCRVSRSFTGVGLVISLFCFILLIISFKRLLLFALSFMLFTSGRPLWAVRVFRRAALGSCL